VEYADIAKGFETDEGEMVVLTDDDLSQLPSRSSREISVEKFVPGDQIDPMMLEKSYYLEPEKGGVKPYALLRDALNNTDRVAVVTVALRNRTTPAVLRVRDDVLVMQTLMWPDEIREPSFSSLDDVGDATAQELKMAELLLETLAGDYDAGDFQDDYAAAVHSMVEQKLEGGEVTHVKAEKPSSGEVVDLLAALQKSVAAAKSARGESVDEGDADSDTGSGASGTTPTKKAAAQKSPAKKSSAKKTPAKKTAAKKGGAAKTTSKKTTSKRGAKKAS
jgi:DNA end-binding protein Ku